MLKKSISLLLSFIILLSLISFNAIILLNSTFIFKLYMLKTNIPSTLSIPLNKILFDYNNMISYLRNPFIKNLSFDYFTLSNFGRTHFLEVKQIFLFIYLFSYPINNIAKLFIYKKKSFTKKLFKLLIFYYNMLFYNTIMLIYNKF